MTREKVNQLKPIIGLVIFSMGVAIINPRFLSIYNILIHF